MSDVKKMIIIIASLLAVSVGIVFVLNTGTPKNLNVPDDYAYNAIPEETKMSEALENKVSDEAVFNINSDRYVVTETKASVSGIALPDEYIMEPYKLFDEKEVSEKGLKGDVRKHDIAALTAYFDNIAFYPGMHICDITDYSYWYSNRENDIIAPGGTGYICLENDFWTSSEISLVDRVARNGDVVLWFYNDKDIDAMIRDCAVYKYQISFVNSYDNYMERPELFYLDKYILGQDNGIEKADDTEILVSNSGMSYKRYIYGNDGDCQVFIDMTGEHGFTGLTVTQNYYNLNNKG